jgi:glutamate/tyrosine decarboxylase-like PLP-dependent enzyme
VDSREKLKNLERIARQLEPPAVQRQALLEAFGAYAQSFLEALPETKTYTPDPGDNAFADYPLEDDPADIETLLRFYRRAVDTTGILPASGGQLGYIPGGGLFPSALGDFLADISNRYSGVAFASPGAARMEWALIDWMCRLVGYPEGAAGDLTSGGSIASLSALVVARDARGVGPADIPDTCIYLTRQAHHCIDTALHVAGLGAVRKRIVPMDAHFRLNVAELERMVEEDLGQGLRPWLVVGSAGTTDTGAVDPIARIAEVAARHGLWFHLDAAYGGFFLLCEEGREKLAGIAAADSIVMDPHKGLGIPYGSGAVLVRDGRLLAESFSYYADYMQDAKRPGYNPGTEFSPSEYSPELTRPFRGPRLWFPLKLFGLAPFRAALAEKIWLARYFHDRISAMQGFETGPRPDLSIVTFRCRPRLGDANAFNRRLLAAVHEDGEVFLTSTQIDGMFTLRLAVLNFRTHLDRIDYLLELLQRKAGELSPGE